MKTEQKVTEHQKKCQHMLEKALDGEAIFAFLERREFEEGYIRFSLITNEMLKYDKEKLALTSEELIKDDYRPYFFSFIAYLAEEKNNEIQDLFAKNESGWFGVRIVPVEATNNNDKDDVICLEGEIEWSASPVIYISRKLEISKTVLPDEMVKNINNMTIKMTAEADKVIASRIQNELDEVTLNEALIYKVGNGNAIKLEGKKKDSNGIVQKYNAMFDIGYHEHSAPKIPRKQYNPAVGAFRYLKPNVVFLSHWDSDHIMGTVYASKSIFKCNWYAPEISIKHTGANGRRLAAYLFSIKKLHMISRDKSKSRKIGSFANDTVHIYMGKEEAGNEENSSGIAIVVKNDDVRSAFHGDAPYKCMKQLWNDFNGLEYIIAPHHGAETADYSSISSKTGMDVLFSANCNSSQRCKYRPAGTHVDAVFNNVIYVTERGKCVAGNGANSTSMGCLTGTYTCTTGNPVRGIKINLSKGHVVTII